MRERIGVVFSISGCILLLEPDLTGSELLDQLRDGVLRYWPLGLILIGFFLVSSKRKRARTRR